MGRIVLVAFVLICCICPFYAQAADMGPILSGESKSGTISTSGQIDSWTFECQSGDLIRFRKAKTGGYNSFAVKMTLMDPAYNIEVVIDPGTMALDHIMEMSGTYTIRIEDVHLSLTGTYSLGLMNLTRGPFMSSGDTDGGLIASGQSLNGSIGTKTDMDVFQINVTAGDLIRFRTAKIDGYTSFTPRVVLIDPDLMNEIAAGTGALDHVMAKSGTYKVLVEDANLSLTGTYSLGLINLTRGPFMSSGDADGSLIASGKSLNGSIGTRTDMDVFQINVTAGDLIRFRAAKIDGYTSFTPRVVLIDPDLMNEIATGPGALDHVMAKSGTYKVLVEDANLSLTGTYSIGFLKMPGTFTSSSDCDGGLMVPGQTKIGSIGTRADLDVYCFYGNSGDRILINLAKTGGYTSFSPRMIMMRQDYGEEISQTAGPIDYTLQQDGFYMIRVEDVNLVLTGTYSLTMNKHPDTLRPGIYNAFPAKTCNISLDPILSWDAVAEATGYDVFMGIGGAAALDQIATNIPTNSLAVTSVMKGNQYDWQVVAHTPNGDVIGEINWFMSAMPCDLNTDCRCDMQDWLLFGQRWGATNCNTVACSCDLNADSRCDMRDWLIFSQNWGANICH